MNVNNAYRFKFYIGMFLLLVVQCTTKNETQSGSNSFDRTAFLISMADNLIIPTFEDFQKSQDSLHAYIKQFVEIPSGANLALVQKQLIHTYEKFQACAFYDMGPALDEFGATLKENLNTFPARVSLIEQFINNGNISVNNFNRDSRGFPALDYLLFHTPSGYSDIADAYGKQTNRGLYLLTVSSDIKQKTDKTLFEWKSSYRETFIRRNSTDASSSITVLYNSWIATYESIKNFKLGLPMGKRAGQTKTEPTLVEAYHSRSGVKTLQSAWRAFENSYRGVTGTSQFLAWNSYLQSATGGTDIHNEIVNKITVINGCFQKLPDRPLDELVFSKNQTLDSLYMHIVRLTVYVKSEMSSKLGISITYSSGDGD